MRRLRGMPVAFLVAVLALAGCTSATGNGASGAAAESAPPGPPCVTAPASADATGSSGPAASADATGSSGPAASGGAGRSSSPAAGEPLPGLTLPCFAGGQPVRLAHLGTPTVINLWASWCGPCRAELPEIQRYADRVAGRVQVVGVITTDKDRKAAQALVDDFGLRFPMLYDEQGRLRAEVGAPTVLPVTLLIDAQGRVAHRYSGRPLDEAALAGLVDRYLGVKA